MLKAVVPRNFRRENTTVGVEKLHESMGITREVCNRSFLEFVYRAYPKKFVA